MIYNDAMGIPFGIQNMMPRESTIGAAAAPDTWAQTGCSMAARAVLELVLDDLNAALGPLCDSDHPGATESTPPAQAATDDAAEMVAALETYLGESFTPSDRAAWIQAYAVLAKTIVGPPRTA